MTPAELRALAESPVPDITLQRSLARLCAEMGEALQNADDLICDFIGGDIGYPELRSLVIDIIRPALAKLEALEAR